MAIIFKSVVRARLPHHDAPGTIAWTNDTRELFMYSVDGTPCPISDILTLKVTEMPGRDGKDGKDGRDGVDGKQGPQGAKGEKGDLLYVGPAEIAAAHEQLKRRAARVRALIETHRAKAKGYSNGTRQTVEATLNIIERELERK